MEKEVGFSTPEAILSQGVYITRGRTRPPVFRRSRMELYMEILRAIYRGRDSLSRIVYAANLSYDRVSRCVRFLEERNLVQKKPGRERTPRYRLTPEGVEVIGYFTKIQSAILDERSDT